MLSLGKTVISMDIFEKKFCCDLIRCKGACCFHGDSGAPLEEAEAITLERIWPLIRGTLRAEGIAAVEEKGTSMIDTDGDLVTPLIGKEECAYALVEESIYRCAIEKAWQNGIIDFRKPLSCHLFPVRIKKYAEFDAVNYEEWKICRPAFKRGEADNVPVYSFLKESLIRVYGQKWYRELTKVASELGKRAEGKRD